MNVKITEMNVKKIEMKVKKMKMNVKKMKMNSSKCVFKLHINRRLIGLIYFVCVKYLVV